MITLLTFNFYGYRLLINFMQEGSTTILEQHVDAQRYNREDLVSVKTRLNLPYYTGSSSFERVYGSIRINGTYYEYVERRVYNDTLEILCLPNHQKTALESAGTDIAKSSATDGGKPDKKSNPLKISIPDFVLWRSQLLAPQPVIVTCFRKPSSIKFSTSDFSVLPERPPQVVHVSV